MSYISPNDFLGTELKYFTLDEQVFLVSCKNEDINSGVEHITKIFKFASRLVRVLKFLKKEIDENHPH